MLKKSPQRIRVTSRQNHWETFRRIISQHKHSPPTVYPKVEIVSTKRFNTRLRVRKHRDLAERDECYYQVRLPASVVIKLVAEMQVPKQQDILVGDRAWQRMVGDMIAEVIKLTVKRKA